MTTLEFPWLLDREPYDVTIEASYTRGLHTLYVDQPEELDVRAVDRDGNDVPLMDEELRDLELEVRDRVRQEAADVAIEAHLLAQEGN